MNEEAEIIANLYIVRICAARMTRRAKGIFSGGDLYQEGCIGLIEAVRSYRDDKGMRRQSYYFMKVKHRIVDGLRSFDHLSRRERAEAKVTGEYSVRVLSLDSFTKKDMESVEQLTEAPKPVAPDELEGVVRDHLQFLVGKGLISFKHATAFLRHTLGDEKMKPIADSLGVTESRVCQLVKETSKMLRGAARREGYK